MKECLDHYEGFENERRFDMIFGQAACECPHIMARTVKRIIAHFDPDFSEGLFKHRPCKRKLRYIGCGCEESPCPHGEEDFFQIGHIYESIEFSGATYSIVGYGEGKKYRGRAYFERVT